MSVHLNTLHRLLSTRTLFPQSGCSCCRAGLAVRGSGLISVGPKVLIIRLNPGPPCRWSKDVAMNRAWHVYRLCRGKHLLWGCVVNSARMVLTTLPVKDSAYRQGGREGHMSPSSGCSSDSISGDLLLVYVFLNWQWYRGTCSHTVASCLWFYTKNGYWVIKRLQWYLVCIIFF